MLVVSGAMINYAQCAPLFAVSMDVQPTWMHDHRDWVERSHQHLGLCKKSAPSHYPNPLVFGPEGQWFKASICLVFVFDSNSWMCQIVGEWIMGVLSCKKMRS